MRGMVIQLVIQVLERPQLPAVLAGTAQVVNCPRGGSSQFSPREGFVGSKAAPLHRLAREPRPERRKWIRRHGAPPALDVWVLDPAQWRRLLCHPRFSSLPGTRGIDWLCL